jgi:tetratricopeptide (TPR) repeat protein
MTARRMLPILLAAAAAAALAAPFAAPAAAAAPASPTVQKEIVVTGPALSQSRRALEACLARKCLPKEDIDATLAYAENLFLVGQYAEARRVAHASVGRNGRFAKQYPIDVSDLYRATGRIASHLGEGGDYERSTTAMRRVLQGADLPKADVRLFSADLEVAGMYASLGRTDRARQIYSGLERDARAANRPDVAGMARVRQAYLSELDGEGRQARVDLLRIAADPAPDARVARISALVLLARMDRKDGRSPAPDALIRELRAAGAVQPILIYSPPVALPSNPQATEMTLAEATMAGNTSISHEANDVFEKRWADIGFWITPDGKVSDVEILRSHGSLAWADPLLRSLEGRRYTPAASPPGTYRVERYTYTSLWNAQSGSHMRQRSANARLEYIDLSTDNAPPAAPPSGG